MPPKFAHALRLARYNAPRYASAAAAALVGLGIASSHAAPTVLRWSAGVAVAAILWFAGASFAAFHWMFDRSELLDGRWLASELPRAPVRWVQLGNGLDATSLPLHEIFPDAVGVSLDIYDPSAMGASALHRARRHGQPSPSVSARLGDIPIGDRACDLVLVTLAAHEIRDLERRGMFFRELARIVTTDGRVVVVEHVRDLVAALAFGPGVLHFLPRGEWLRLGVASGLTLTHERSITPFVRVFVYR